ncbi:MAG: alpha/beta hydrolase [Burkholderiales bacterium]|nr:MAG: alpha/beta hydrolase [Burkholderiales bacterium]
MAAVVLRDSIEVNASPADVFAFFEEMQCANTLESRASTSSAASRTATGEATRCLAPDPSLEPSRTTPPPLPSIAMSTLRWIALALFALAIAAAAAYVLDIGRAYERVAGRSKVIPSPDGNIEFTEGGSGPAVLVIHGSGGGYDQGELIAQALIGESFHWIAPSRFGYLRSTFREGATFDDQARAYAHLLDHLGMTRSTGASARF